MLGQWDDERLDCINESCWSIPYHAGSETVNLLHSEVRPSCLQATIASLKSQESSHTVPHCPWKHTSTRPSKLVLPSTNRISVLLQTGSEDVRQNIHILTYITCIGENE